MFHPLGGSRTAMYQMISRTAYGQVNDVINSFGGPYVAESEPRSSSSGAHCGRIGRAPTRFV